MPSSCSSSSSPSLSGCGCQPRLVVRSPHELRRSDLSIERRGLTGPELRRSDLYPFAWRSQVTDDTDGATRQITAAHSIERSSRWDCRWRIQWSLGKNRVAQYAEVAEATEASTNSRIAERSLRAVCGSLRSLRETVLMANAGGSTLESPVDASIEWGSGPQAPANPCRRQKSCVTNAGGTSWTLALN